MLLRGCIVLTKANTPLARPKIENEDPATQPWKVLTTNGTDATRSNPPMLQSGQRIQVSNSRRQLYFLRLIHQSQESSAP